MTDDRLKKTNRGISRKDAKNAKKSDKLCDLCGFA